MINPFIFDGLTIIYHHKNFCYLCQTFILMKTSSSRRICSLLLPLSNIHLVEDVLKRFRRRLSSSSSEDLFKTSSRRLHRDEYVRLSLMSSEEVFKTRSIYLSWLYVFKTSPRRFQDVFKTSAGRFQDVFKTSSRRLQNVFKTFSWRVQDVFKDVLQRCL